MAVTTVDAARLPAEKSPGRQALERLLRRKGAIFGLVVIAFFVALAVLAPWISPYDPMQTSWSRTMRSIARSAAACS